MAQDLELLCHGISLFGFFFAAALVACVPRVIALASITLRAPQARMPEALTDFKSMWAPCKDPKNMFPAYSPDGMVYKLLATTNDVITVLMTSISSVCMGYAWVQVELWHQRTWLRAMLLTALRLFVVFSICVVGFPIASHVVLHRAGAWAEDDATRDINGSKGHIPRRPATLEQPDLALATSMEAMGWGSTGIVMMGLLAKVLAGHSRPGYQISLARECLVCVWVPYTAYIGLWIGFWWFYSDMTDSSSDLSAAHILWPLFWAKIFTSIMRFSVTRLGDSLRTEEKKFVYYLAFMLDFSISIYVRIRGWGRVSPTSDRTQCLSAWLFWEQNVPSLWSSAGSIFIAATPISWALTQNPSMAS